MDDSIVEKREGVNWRQVGLYLGLTFGLTWLLDLALWLAGGYGQNGGTTVVLQLQMLLPAFCAIVLELFVFQNSALYQMRRSGERPIIFYYCFIAYTLIFAAVGIAALVSEAQAVTVASSLVAQGLTVLGLLVLIALRVASDRETFARAGLSGAKPVLWLLFAIGFALFYGLQTLLNIAFHLGEPVDVAQLMLQSLPGEEMPPLPSTAFMLITGVQAVLLAPFLALLISFGEEYGWRGYLQRELVKLGKVKGILLLGIIWGIWHAPVIMMGHNYPGYPLAGVFLMTAYTVGLGFALSYAVFKSGSVLLASYLHALNNQVLSFLTVMVYQPSDPVFSFGVGLYGLITLAIVVLLILRDPIWKRNGGQAR
jgi:membrane protease YdiL (CAAX protease family)